MAFNIEAFDNVSSGSADGVRVWSYKSTSDTLAQIAAAGYFNQMRFALRSKDIIILQASDGTNMLTVTSAVNADSVTTQNFTLEESGGATMLLYGESFGSKPNGVSRIPLVIGSEPDTGTTGSNINKLQLCPIIIPTSLEYDRIGVNVVTATFSRCSARLGIYSINDDGSPGPLVLDAGTVAIDVNSSLSEAVISQTLFGKYYMAMIAGDPSGSSAATYRESESRVFSSLGNSSATSNASLFGVYHDYGGDTSVWENGLPESLDGLSWTLLAADGVAIFVRKT